MDLAAAGRTLRKRWILTSFLFLLTLVAAAAAWVKIPGPYQAESMVVLYPSKQASKLNGNNPLMSFGGSLNVAGDIVLREVMAPGFVAKMAGKGYTSSYTVADDPNTTGPILDITVTGSNKAQVENTLQGVTAAVQQRLNVIQSGYLPNNRITSGVVSTDPTASLLVSKKARNIVIIAGLGLVLTFAIPQIVEGEASRRRGDRARRATTNFASATPQTAPPAPPAPPAPDLVDDEPTERGQPQPAYQGSPATTPPEPRAPRYGVPARPDYAPPRTDRYPAERGGRPGSDRPRTDRPGSDRPGSDRPPSERRYGAAAPGNRGPRPGDAGQEYPQRQSEGSRI
jgi:capsular polysaccharide biosynthesis protein